MEEPLVSIIMGSDSDLNVMQQTADILESFGIPFEMTIVSAHRTPDRLYSYSKSAHERGIKVIIAGAGGAAHIEARDRDGRAREGACHRPGRVGGSI